MAGTGSLPIERDEAVRRTCAPTGPGPAGRWRFSSDSGRRSRGPAPHGGRALHDRSSSRRSVAVIASSLSGSKYQPAWPPTSGKRCGVGQRRGNPLGHGLHDRDPETLAEGGKDERGRLGVGGSQDLALPVAGHPDQSATTNRGDRFAERTRLVLGPGAQQHQGQVARGHFRQGRGGMDQPEQVLARLKIRHRQQVGNPRRQPQVLSHLRTLRAHWPARRTGPRPRWARRLLDPHTRGTLRSVDGC